MVRSMEGLDSGLEFVEVPKLGDWMTAGNVLINFLDNEIRTIQPEDIINIFNQKRAAYTRRKITQFLLKTGLEHLSSPAFNNAKTPYCSRGLLLCWREKRR